MDTIYFLSGLGADERVFKSLNLIIPNEIFIKWIQPDTTETLESYSQKISKQISNPTKSILIGVSFGGVIACELSKILNFHKIIIISSIKSSDEKPFLIKILKLTKIYKLFPKILFNKYNIFLSYAFGKKSKSDNQLLKTIINDTNTKFAKWAVDKIITWNNKFNNEKIIHIHGNKDRLFPIKNISNVIEVDGGGHFMIVNKSALISDIINREIKSGFQMSV